MRRSLGVTGVCFLILLFLTGQAYSSAHKSTSARNSKKASKEHRRLGSRLARKGKAASMGSSGRLADSTEEPVRLQTGQGHRHAHIAKRVVLAEETPTGTNEGDEYMEYRVKRGDTLEKLAQRFNIEKEEITELNRVAKRRLMPGTIVYIPKTEEETNEEPVALVERPLKPWKSSEEQGILVKVAESFSGAPYRFGGESVRGLDCSAFVKKMYEIFEVQLPRCAREQFYAGPRISKENLLTGDLVFFKTKRNAKEPTHVGIYIGDGKFIHASSLFGRGVKVDRLSDAYFARTYTGAVRVKAPPEPENPEANP
jgi:cell wall-associated NlpC family hydrolase